jgi:16S rRNA (uracil1498-N3)-methyltransferase
MIRDPPVIVRRPAVDRPPDGHSLPNMADRFYVNCPLAEGPIVLAGPEAHHLATVMRARPGAAVCLFNGDGAEYPAVVTAADKKQVILQITGRRIPERELAFRLEVAAPLPKGDRGDFLIEKLTELGVTRYVPLRTERSIVHPGDTKLEKLGRTVIEASKQCGRNSLMEVEKVTPWHAYCHDAELPTVRIVAHPVGEMPVLAAAGNVAIAIGPEGGFTDEEIADARTAGWKAIGIGPRILRIETAAMAIAAICGVCQTVQVPR